MAYLDRIAELTINVNDRFPEMQAAYENDNLANFRR